MNKKLSLSAKAILSFTIIAIIMLIMTSKGIYKVQSQYHATEFLLTTEAETISLSQEMDISLINSSRFMKGWLLYKDDSYTAKWRAAWQKVEGYKNKLTKLSFKWNNEKLLTSFNEFNNLLTKLYDIQSKIYSFTDIDIDAKHIKEHDAILAQIQDKFYDLVTYEKGILNTHIQDQKEAVYSFNTQMTISLILGLSISFAAAYYFRKSLNNELSEFTRILEALNTTESSIMVADANYNICYVNRSLNKLMTKNEQAIQKELPNFDVHNLLGTNIDAFHKDPSMQREMLDNLSKAYKTEIKFSSNIMKLTVNPVFSHLDERIGTIVEWKDVSMERKAENEIDHTLTEAIQGNLDSRIDVIDKTGFIKIISEKINNMLNKNRLFIEEVSQVMQKLFEGDLTQQITAEFLGEYGKLKSNINDTITNLNEVISNITTAGYSTEQGISEIAEGNMDLQSRTETQASTLEETAANMEEMSSSIKESTSNAQEALDLALLANKKADEGGLIVNQVVEAMNEISSSSKKINDIISVIDEIAFQTNLLSLNAAVEAARAGEQGRGFAVVASEVRNLAQRSADSAKEIKDLIKDSSDKVNEGATLAQQSGEALSDILNSVKSVTEAVTSISHRSQEQNTGVQEINCAITNLEQVTQQNSALGEEVASASQELKHQAQDLHSQVSRFTVKNSHLLKSNSIMKLVPNSVPKTTNNALPSKPETINKVVPKPKIEDNTIISPNQGNKKSDDEWESF